MFKVFTVIVLFVVALVVSTTVVDQDAPDQSLLLQQFSHSPLKKVVPERYFQRFSRAYPASTEFVLGLDPAISADAYGRWFVLILAGWLHFCFLSRWTRALPFGLTRKEVFLAPLGAGVLFFILSAGISLLKSVNQTVGIWGDRLCDVLTAVCFCGFVAVSLLSIPVSLVLLLIQSVKATFRVGMRLYTGKTPQISEKPKIPPETKRIPQRLPGPVVKRIEINGVKYDI